MSDTSVQVARNKRVVSFAMRHNCPNGIDLHPWATGRAIVNVARPMVNETKTRARLGNCIVSK